jgi:hypothetical protein
VDSEEFLDQLVTLSALAPRRLAGPSGFGAVRLFSVGADMERHAESDRPLGDNTRALRCENRTGPSGLAADFSGWCRQGEIMRHAIRIQPYLSRDLFQKLRTYAAAHSKTLSAVVAGALDEYLEQDEPDHELLGRRLDRVTQTVEQLGRDLDALGVGFGRFVQYSLWSIPEADDKAIRRGEGLYRGFLSKVAQQIRAGGTFTGQVFPARQPPTVPPNPTPGGRDEGGRS